MGYYDTEFYDEPSEFDVMMHEFKQSLLADVKKEYVDEMNRLRKENAELQDVKLNFSDIKSDYSKKKNELEREYQDLKGKVRRERLSALMKELEVELYTVSTTSHEKQKCNKCDENRRIYYTTPLGNEAYESCDCSKRISIYKPHPILLNSFSIRNGEGNAWYQVKVDGSDEWLSYYDDSISGNELIADESQFENIGYAYKALFKTEELAQKFSDYKNEKMDYTKVKTMSPRLKK